MWSYMTGFFHLVCFQGSSNIVICIIHCFLSNRILNFACLLLIFQHIQSDIGNLFYFPEGGAIAQLCLEYSQQIPDPLNVLSYLYLPFLIPSPHVVMKVFPVPWVLQERKTFLQQHPTQLGNTGTQSFHSHFAQESCCQLVQFQAMTPRGGVALKNVFFHIQCKYFVGFLLFAFLLQQSAGIFPL